jgi:hypothetical protein
MNKNRKDLVKLIEIELTNKSPEEIKRNMGYHQLAIFDKCLAQAGRRIVYKFKQREMQKEKDSE